MNDITHDSADGLILRYLWVEDAPIATMPEVVDALGLTQTRVRKAVIRLETARLIARESGAYRRNSNEYHYAAPKSFTRRLPDRLSLTDAGRTLAASLSRTAAYETLLGLLRAGSTLKDAARDAGIPISTVKWRRRTDSGFDRQVIAAAAAGGTVLRPAVTVECPGPRCGTPTGYDYGCRETPCRTVKSAMVVEASRRKTNA